MVKQLGRRIPEKNKNRRTAKCFGGFLLYKRKKRFTEVFLFDTFLLFCSVFFIPICKNRVNGKDCGKLLGDIRVQKKSLPLADSFVIVLPLWGKRFVGAVFPRFEICFALFKPLLLLFESSLPFCKFLFFLGNAELLLAPLKKHVALQADPRGKHQEEPKRYKDPQHVYEGNVYGDDYPKGV
jgi:hypothetical protein